MEVMGKVYMYIYTSSVLLSILLPSQTTLAHVREGRSVRSSIDHLLCLFNYYNMYMKVSSPTKLHCYCKHSVLSIGQGYGSVWVILAINGNVLLFIID